MKPLLAALALTLAAGCTARTTALPLPPDQAHALLVERNWIDRLPASEGDRLHVFRFVPSMGGGVYQDRTLFAGQFELFTFEHDGDEIRFHLHHTGGEARARYRIDALGPEEAQGPLDLRLTLDRSPRGPSVYLGARGPGSTDLDADLRALAPPTQRR